MCDMDTSKLSSNWNILKGRLGAASKSSDKAAGTTKKRAAGELETVSEDSRHQSRKRARKEVVAQSQPENSMKLRKSRSYTQSLGKRAAVQHDLPDRPLTSHSQQELNLEALENEGVSATAMAGKFVALDCEMVGVGPTPDQDSQLARVSMVNFHGEQIYDTYVKPKLPVTDYRTAVSGIRPENLRVGRPFREVQSDVATFLQGRILIGHYLKSDFHCLQLKHPKKDIRDSSSLPKFRELVGGRAPKLKVLAKLVLGLDIQGGEHSSVEDARAAMMLYKAEKDAFEAENKRSFPRTTPILQKRTPTINRKRKSKKK